jgi:hypothetical protein
MVSPIQVILNPEHFEEARDTGGGGPRKDFFARRDDEFREHKNALAEQLGTVARAIDAQPQGDIGIVKVILRREAWAKSHRPVRSLFRPDRIAIVGGGDLGEMYFEAKPSGLRSIAQQMLSAENRTRLRDDPASGQRVPNPSSVRSEVGAISRIELYGPADRRRFSVEEAVDWLANPMTGSCYEVELFDVPPPRAHWDALDGSHQRLYATFVDGLAAAGQGLVVRRLRTPERQPPELLLRLGRSSASPIVQLQESGANAGATETLHRSSAIRPATADC